MAYTINRLSTNRYVVVDLNIDELSLVGYDASSIFFTATSGEIRGNQFIFDTASPVTSVTIKAYVPGRLLPIGSLELSIPPYNLTIGQISAQVSRVGSEIKGLCLITSNISRRHFDIKVYANTPFFNTFIFHQDGNQIIITVCDVDGNPVPVPASFWFAKYISLVSNDDAAFISAFFQLSNSGDTINIGNIINGWLPSLPFMATVSEVGDE